MTKPRKPLKRAVPPARQPSLQHQLRAHAQPQQRPAGLPLRSIDDAAESSVRPAFVIVPLAAGVVCLIISTVFSTGRQRGAGRGGAIAAPVSTQQPQWPNQPAAGAAPEAHSRRMRTAVGSPASITRHLHTQGYEEIAFDEDDNDKEVDGLRANRAHHPLGNRVQAAAGALRRSVSTTAATLHARARSALLRGAAAVVGPGRAADAVNGSREYRSAADVV